MGIVQLFCNCIFRGDFMDSYFKLQQAIREFWDVPEELIRQLYSICSQQVIRKGEFFIRNGDTPKYMGLNLEGLFRFYYIDKEGHNHLTNLFWDYIFLFHHHLNLPINHLLHSQYNAH